MPKRYVQPELPTQGEEKSRGRVMTYMNGSRTVLMDVSEDDPSIRTIEGDARAFINQQIRRFNQSIDGEMYSRTEGLKDVLMVEGDGQWDEAIRARRMRKKRPCLTINRFKPMLKHVANEQRMSRPAIQIDPVGGGADRESASIRQGLIRHIEVLSGAETVYDTAFERMIEKGWSWFRVVTDWESPTSFQQVIRIEGFANDFCVYGDPTAEEPTRKDMKWAFIVHDMQRGEYVAQYPNSEIIGLPDFTSIGDDAMGWITSETVRVAECYYLDEEPVNVVKLLTGDGVFEDEIEERAGLWWFKAELKAYDEDRMAAEDLKEVPVDLSEGKFKTRKSHRPKVKWCKFNAVEILDGNMGDDPKRNTAGREIAGLYIPLIMVCGEDRIVNGQRRLSGMVRNNRDAQRMYNYSISAFVEMIALAPKSPFIAAMSQIEKFKAIWDTANEENWPVLPYEPQTVNGQNVPPPQRTEYNPQVGALIQAILQFDNVLKIGFNIFDPTLGSPHSDQSGRAVAALQVRAESANMHWLDNMRRAQMHCGEIILAMIPVIYDAPRIVTIIRADQAEEIQINQEFARKDGKLVNFDMARGKYAVTVSLGEYASKRQQAVQSLSKIAEAVPEVALPLLPLILDNMDSPMAKEAAEIIKRLQPPQVQKPGSPEQMETQFRELAQQHEMLIDALEKANQALEGKQMDHASKEFIAGLQAQAQVAIAAMKLNSTEGMKMATMEFERLTGLLNQSHERIQLQQQQAHELLLQENEPEPAGATA